MKNAMVMTLTIAGMANTMAVEMHTDAANFFCSGFIYCCGNLNRQVEQAPTRVAQPRISTAWRFLGRDRRSGRSCE